MANETKITDIVGKSAYEQLQKLNVELNTISESYAYAAKEMAKGLSFNPTSLTELTQKIANYEESLKRLQIATDANNQAQKKQSKIINDVAAARKEQAQAEREAAVIATEQSKIEAERSKATLNLATAKKNLSKATEEDSKASLSAAGVHKNEARVLEEQSRAELSSARSKLNLAKAGDIAAKAESQYGGISRMTAADVEKLISTLDIANLSYKEQAMILSQLKAFSKIQTGGVQVVSPNTLDTIKKLDTSLKEQDAKLGIYGRNVGNYKSHWDGLSNSVAQLTREMPAFAVSVNTGFLALSNNIPMLADEIKRIRLENQALKAEGSSTVPVWKQIAKSFLSWNTVLSVGVTLLTVYGKDIYDWTKKLFTAADASQSLSDVQKDLTSSTGNFAKELKNSSSNYGENLVSIKKLQEEWTSLGDSLDKKKQFIIDNTSEFKKLDVSVTNVNEAENVLVTNTPVFIEALKDRAKAAAAAKIAQDKYGEAVLENNKLDAITNEENEIMLKLQQDLEKSQGDINKRNELYESNNNKLKKLKAERTEIEKNILAINAQGDAYFDYSLKSSEASQASLKNSGIEESTNKEKLKREEERKNKELERIANEAKKKEKLEMEAERNIQESKNKLLEEGYEKERISREASYQKRIDEVKTKGIRVNEQIVAIEAEREKDLSDFREEYEAKRLMIDAQNRVETIKKGSIEELDAKLDVMMLQRDVELKEAEKTGADILSIEDKYNKLIENAYLDFGKNQLKKQQDQNEIELSEKEISLNQELAILDQNYAKGLIKKRDYEKQKSDLEFKFAMEALNNEINLLEQNLDLFSGDERLEMEKKIASLRVKLSKETTDKIISDGDREIEGRKRVEELKKQLVQEVAKAIEDIGNSMFERRIQDVEEEIKVNQDEYDEKIASIDALAEKDVITKEEAEAQKRVAEEQTAAKNRELEKEKAALQTKQAKFQKTIDIAKVIASTAAAIMKTYADLGPFIGAPVSALIAAIGAIQLATIIAQPIPKYAKGTDNHPGGLAMVGDGGKHEAVIIGGKAYITPNVPTLLSMPKGVEVLPDIHSKEFYDRFMDNTFGLTHNNAGEPVSIVNNFDTTGIIKSSQEVKKEIQLLARITRRNSRERDFNAYKNFKIK